MSDSNKAHKSFSQQLLIVI